MTCMLINPFVEQSHYLLIALWMCSFSFYAIATTQNKACGGLHRCSAICVAPTGMGVSLASQFSCLPQGLYWPDEKRGGTLHRFPPRRLSKGSVWGCHWRNTGLSRRGPSRTSFFQFSRNLQLIRTDWLWKYSFSKFAARPFRRFSAQIDCACALHGERLLKQPPKRFQNEVALRHLIKVFDGERTREAPFCKKGPLSQKNGLNAWGRNYTLAAVRRSATASVASQVNSGSSRPKWP